MAQQLPSRPLPPSAPPWYRRFWSAIKPPPPAVRAGAAPKRSWRREIRILLLAMVASVLVYGGWKYYTYEAGAPLRARVLYNEGVQLITSGSYGPGADRLTASIQEWPHMPGAYLERGMAYREMEQSESALKDFEKAAQMDPTLTAAHIALGELYRGKGDVQRAIEEFTLSIKTQPSVDSYYQRGETFRAQGRFPEAVSDFEQAIALERDAPYVYRAMAAVKRSMGDEQAYRDFRATADELEHVNPLATP